jgi:hypothetical protein
MYSGNRNDKNNKTVSKLNKDVMSNLFFQLGPKHSRLHQFEDYEKKFRSGILSKNLSPIYDFRNRDLKRNRITSDTLYVFNETNRKPSEFELNPKYFFHSDELLNKEFFPTQVTNSSVTIPKTKKIKENKKDEDDSDDEFKPPEIHHKQIVFLKGKSNKTYLLKYYKNANPYNTTLNELDLTPFIPSRYIKLDKKLDEYAMMERLEKNRKPAFKIK